MKKIIIKFIVILFFLYTVPLSATNYYVAANGSSSNNGTIGSPYNFSTALVYASAGDTIFLRTGTYTFTSRITISKSGTSENNKVCIMAYQPDLVSAYPTDARPVFDFSGMAYGSGNQGIYLSGCNYLHIKGIRVYGAGDNGMQLRQTNNCIIEFCDFYKNRDSGFQMMDGSSNNLILNCDSYMNADIEPGVDDGGDADGFAPKLTVGTGNVFRGCRAWLNSDDGWDGYLKTTTEYPDGMTTTLENCWTWFNGYYWDGSDFITNSGMNGNGFKLGGSDNKDEAHNFILKRCLSFNNKAKGFDQNNNAGSITLYNCSAYNNEGQDYMFNSSGVTYASDSEFKVSNCIALGTSGTSFRSTTIKETNDFSTAQSDYVSTDTTGIGGQRTVDGELPALDFMHLQTNEPATDLIDAGTIVEGIQYNGDYPDLGCFETGAPLPTFVVNNALIDVSVYPNPAVDYFKISLNADGKVVTIYSIQGALLKKVTLNSQVQKIDVSGLKSGVYIVKISSEKIKLIKM
ncbi:MAG: T9SS type A sorting domain-containing protein [Chloroflexia bacterium]|nr:T9SS type A sorting domain-containing protein [Chloroflexia bacterium]